VLTVPCLGKGNADKTADVTSVRKSVQKEMQKTAADVTSVRKSVIIKPETFPLPAAIYDLISTYLTNILHSRISTLQQFFFFLVDL